MTPRFRDALAIGFAAFFPLPMAWAYFVYLADVSESNSTLVTAYGVAKSVQFAFPLVFVLEQVTDQCSSTDTGMPQEVK